MKISAELQVRASTFMTVSIEVPQTLAAGLNPLLRFLPTTLIVAPYRIVSVQESLRAWHGMLRKYVSEEEKYIVNGHPFVVPSTL